MCVCLAATLKTSGLKTGQVIVLLSKTLRSVVFFCLPYDNHGLVRFPHSHGNEVKMCTEILPFILYAFQCTFHLHIMEQKMRGLHSPYSHRGSLGFPTVV